MSADSLGLRLREILLRQALVEPGSLDGRRLQGLAGDLCGPDQQDLLPALRYLVLCPPFLRSLRASPPLADPRLLEQLRTELGQVFAPGLCARMEPVLEGLLDRPSTLARQEAPPPPPLQPPSPSPSTVSALSTTAEGKERGSVPSALVALLAFLSGGLAVVLAAVLSGVELPGRSPSAVPLASPYRADQPAPPLANPADRPSPESIPTPAPPELPAPPEENAAIPSPPPSPPVQGDAGESQATADTAVTSSVAVALAAVEAVYALLSAGDATGALQRMDGSAADQFDPAFFRRFQEVRVSELRATAAQGSTVTLEGVVSFLYPDGSRQRESRTFTVDTARNPARITASAFGRVLSPRR